MAEAQIERAHSIARGNARFRKLVESDALGKAQQIVWLIAVRFRLDVFVAPLTGGDYDPNALTACADIEAPFAAIDVLNRRLLGDLPAFAVSREWRLAELRAHRRIPAPKRSGAIGDGRLADLHWT